MKVELTPDSYLIKAALQAAGIDGEALFTGLSKAENFWMDRTDEIMIWRGHPIPRTKAFLSTEGPDVFLKYNYPAFQWPTVLQYEQLSDYPELETAIRAIRFNGQPLDFNHVILTMYETATDNIGLHSDNMLDIEAGTNIYSISLGDKREFRLTRSKEEKGHIETLESGDLFILGPETNAVFMHEVLSAKKSNRTECGPRISIVLRTIKTRLTREQVIKAIENSEKSKVRNAAAKKRAREE